MPSVFGLQLDTLGAGLDDKARTALQQQVDPICALAILLRVSEQGEAVRNPSAFVATAVRNGAGRGPSLAELEGALQLLNQDGTLDDNAVGMLKRGSLEDATQALSSLLIQEVSAVRNASAYVTRNVANARKHPPAMQTTAAPLARGTGMSMGGMGMAPGLSATTRQAARLGQVGEALLARWAPLLDEKAMDALMSLPVSAATAVLHEMDGKAASVRKPSAYVQKACENRKEERHPTASLAELTLSTAAAARPQAWGGRAVGHAVGAGLVGTRPQSDNRPQLDADARDALQKVSEEQASTILENLQSRGGLVRNPSAYVVRSVKNLQDAAGESGAPVGSGTVPGITADHLLAAKPSDALSPCSNNSNGAWERWWGYTPELDETAQTALSELAPEASEAILQQLDAQGDKVKNPSAYVLRAVGNARRGLGAGGAAAAAAVPAGPQSVHEEIAKLGFELDSKATAALEEVGPAAAIGILQKLSKQGAAVNNPNAYIVRAVGNEKRTTANPGSSAIKRPRPF